MDKYLKGSILNHLKGFLKERFDLGRPTGESQKIEPMKVFFKRKLLFAIQNIIIISVYNKTKYKILNSN